MPSPFQDGFYSHLPDKPTISQIDLVERMERFLFEKKEYSAFILRGYAGTGKTTSVSAMIKTFPKIGLKTVLLAPTGRAAKVLSKNASKKALTIHKKIYQSRRNKHGQMEFKRAPNLHQKTIFIIDEASMISEQVQINGSSVIDDLMGYIYSGKSCRAIFVGDTAQLPPVGREISVALDPKYLKSQFKIGLSGAELNEVLRQRKSSGILYNANLLRSQLEEEEFKMQFELANFQDIYRVNGLDLEDELNTQLAKYGLEELKIICRSNKAANAYNQQFRYRILGLEDEIASGDQMMVVKNNYYWLDEKKGNGFIANGDILEIEQMKSIEDKYGFRFLDVSMRLIDYPDLPSIDVKLLLDTINSDHSALKPEENHALFNCIMEEYADVSNKQKRLELVKKDPYFNALQVKFAYAITCHKAQGGQWKSVFVDQGYLTTEMLDKEYIRWLYTAVSRASEVLNLVNFNPRFFAEDS